MRSQEHHAHNFQVVISSNVLLKDELELFSRSAEYLELFNTNTYNLQITLSTDHLQSWTQSATPPSARRLARSCTRQYLTLPSHHTNNLKQARDRRPDQAGYCHRPLNRAEDREDRDRREGRCTCSREEHVR